VATSWVKAKATVCLVTSTELIPAIEAVENMLNDTWLLVISFLDEEGIIENPSMLRLGVGEGSCWAAEGCWRRPDEEEQERGGERGLSI
jgi:hypothetical protein